MELEAIIKNPICIRLGKNLNIILENESGKEIFPLTPGVMFGGEHFGFILISESNGKQREVIYPTQKIIQGIGLKENILKIFEEDREKSWDFDLKGRLIHSTYEDSIDGGITKADIVVRNNGIFTGEPLLLNPVRISVDFDPFKSKILSSDANGIEYPLFPGAMLGALHYGFIILKTGEDGTEIERAYPTQNRIDAVGIEGSIFGDLKVFEEGKYHPWVFTFDGEYKGESSYNPYSKKDKEYVNDEFDLKDSSRDSFQLKKKKDK